MDVKVIEGRLTEVRAGTGAERRAFGEFVGPRGELASYAFGWTTGCDHQVARLTVGIGAGNPGGAGFHAVVFDHEGSYACSLVDEPFERVPEGGPDLTAAQARAHDDLPFIWWVVDRDPTLLEVLDLEPGASAERTGPDAPWIREDH